MQLGLNFTEEEMKDMITEADPSDTGQVNFKGTLHSCIQYLPLLRNRLDI